MKFSLLRMVIACDLVPYDEIEYVSAFDQRFTGGAAYLEEGDDGAIRIVDGVPEVDRQDRFDVEYADGAGDARGAAVWAAAEGDG